MASTSNGCFICQKNPCLFARCCLSDSYGTDQGDTNDYVKLPGTVSWEVEADVTEADEILTCDTNGLLVKACPDSVSFTLNVNSALCPAEWLYNILLEGQNPGVTNELQFFGTWDGTITAAGVSGIAGTGNVPGVFMTGSVTPGGFGVDGSNSTAPIQTEWSANLTNIVFPAQASTTNFNCDAP